MPNYEQMRLSVDRIEFLPKCETATEFLSFFLGTRKRTESWNTDVPMEQMGHGYHGI